MKRTYDSATSAAIAYLTYKERTEQEVRNKLHEYDFSEQEIDETISELYSSLLINDEEYAKEYVKSYLACKPVSKKTLRMKMRKHMLPEHLIDEALLSLSEDSDYENAYAEAYNFFVSNRSSDDERKRREKILRRLVSHGYSFDVAKQAIRAAETDYVSQ